MNSPALLELVIRIVSSFEAAWRSGTPPEIAPFLKDLTGEARSRVLHELVKVDREYRARRGAPMPLEDYVDRFPELRLSADTIDTEDSSLEPGGYGELSGDFIGNYKLLERIGEGGFGEVWLAEQTQPVRRRVALKVIKPGMDSKAVLARFEAERQALALMDHPHIAKVFEAGDTPRGRPYFVMEHVPGVPLTEHCDLHRLTIKQRLELFAKVCDAVAHAHMKGIIHRDLKPSNILVSVRDGGEGVPKIIDFGIAKATQMRLTEHTVFTQEGMLIGTLEYMSPEQAEMSQQDIDTRSDVYSLGVILYELLTGALPFDPHVLRAAGLDEIRRIIREEEAPRPSTRLTQANLEGQKTAEARRTRLDELAHMLRSELEWLPLKALRKDRNERYRSAAEMADDVRNYLAGKPLIAGPESAAYRLRKFVRRNRGPVAAAAAIVALLLGGLIATSLTARWALRERRAAVEATEAKTLALAGETRAKDEAERRAREAELEAYVSNLSAADASLSANEPAGVRARLDACPPELRGWEWRWLDARADTSLVVLRGHQDLVTSAAFSLDGTRVVTASKDMTTRVWDAASRKELAVLRGHDGWVTSAAFSMDGTRVVTASDDKTMRVWDATNGNALAVLEAHTGEVNSSVFGPDGTRIVTTSGNTARVLDTANGKELAILRGHEYMVRSAVFSPDGRRVVTASEDKTAWVWDAANGKDLAILRGHLGEVVSAVFSPDGTRVLTASWDKTARVWDAGSGKELAILRGHEEGVWSAVFSSDGTRVVTASFKTMRVWDATNGNALAVLEAHTEEVNSSVFNPDGTRIVTASGNTARVLDAANGKELAILRGHEDVVRSAVFSPDGTRVLTASQDGTARLWDALSSNDLGILRPQWIGGSEWPVFSAAFSSDGSLVIVSPPSAWNSRMAKERVFDAVSGKELVILRGQEKNVWSAGFSPEGRRVVTAYDDTAWVSDAASGTALAVLKPQAKGVNSFAFSPDGARVVTASQDGTARVWDAASGKALAVLEAHTKEVNSAAFSPDGTRVVTASQDGTARVWDAVSGKELAILRGHEEGVWSAVFSRDGTRVVTASQDGTARVWDAVGGKVLAVLEGHTKGVNFAVFSRDGTRVVTGSNDGTARVWDPASGKELAVLRGHNGWVMSAAFSPDGTRLVTASEDGTARLWDSVPYRVRFPAIAAARAAELAMRPRIEARLRSGEDPSLMRLQLAADPALDPVHRNAALSAVRDHEREAPDEAADLNDQAWFVVRDPASPPEAVASALARAKQADRFEPGRAFIINTLGIAQYRAGKYEACLATLARSAALFDSVGRKEPSDLAFTAMAQFQLGRTEEAKASLARLRELLAKAVDASSESRSFLREAEALIGTK